MYDYVIVGSGPSGAVISQQLVAAGARCVVLEAGKHYTAETFPKDELAYNTSLYWNGAAELNTDSSLVFLRGKCVGGTSIVNQCLLDRFDDIAWADWKAEAEISFFTPEAMAPHYDAVEQHLSITKIPDRLRNGNALTFIRGFEKLGLGWAPMDRGQTNCNIDGGNDCMACLGGCRLDSKQSMLVTFLREAIAGGLELRPEFMVERVEAPGGQVKVYGSSPCGREEITARRLVLAAGVFGNARILFRSDLGGRLPALGTRFSCHPQTMHFGLFKEPVDSHKGAFQSVKSKDDGLRRKGFKLENVFAPPIAISLLVPGWGADHQRAMKRYRYLACMEVAVRDESAGTIRLKRSGRLQVEKRLTPRDEARREAGRKMVDRLLRAAGAYEVIHGGYGFSVHLMGGCVMGSDPSRSVVNEGFSLHASPDVYIADSSAFVNAPGINPSLTVMALSHRAAEAMLKEAS